MFGFLQLFQDVKNVVISFHWSFYFRVQTRYGFKQGSYPSDQHAASGHRSQLLFLEPVGANVSAWAGGSQPKVLQCPQGPLFSPPHPLQLLSQPLTRYLFFLSDVVVSQDYNIPATTTCGSPSPLCRPPLEVFHFDLEVSGPNMEHIFVYTMLATWL